MSNEQTYTGRANIGVVGLAVMGADLARNRATRDGNTVAVYNARRDGLVPSSSSIPKRASRRQSQSPS
jgi:6-phosphogluconate dehydrogenase